MNIIKKNIIANFGGSICIALTGVIFIPLYIHFLGIEAYGLVGIFASLLAISGLFDMGLSSTLNREVARLTVQDGNAQEIRDLVRTLEIPYWAVGLLIGGLVIALSPTIAYHWVNAKNLSPKTVQTAIMIMGLSFAFQWPISFYSGGLMGLQRQVLLNSINVVMAIFRGLGAVLILWLISPTIYAFFTWQIVISIVNTGLLGFFLWHTLPYAPQKATFQKQLLVGIWRFAAGMTGISILATIILQMDKIILSKMLTLEMFGYYTLAGVVGMFLYRIIGSVFFAIYPRFIQLFASDDLEGLKQFYHKSSQFMSVMILPVTVVIAMFSYEIMLLWTQNSVTAQKCHLLVSILICGTAINGLMNIPYALQLAKGWTRLILYTNLISLVVAVPVIIYMTGKYKALGGASVWVMINCGYVLFEIYFMHKRLLPYEKWRWYCIDVGIPLGAALLAAGIFRLTIPIPDNKFMLGGYLFIVSTITLAVTVLATPVTRLWIKNKILKSRFCVN